MARSVIISGLMRSIRGLLSAFSALPLLTLGVAGCSLEGTAPDLGTAARSTVRTDFVTQDDIADDAPATTLPLCTGGRFRCFSQIRATTEGQRIALVAPKGYGPADLQSAYDIPAVTTTPTIGIIGAYGYANLESDLAAYRTQYQLPACSVASGCLTVLNQEGATAPLPAAPPQNDDWTVETALDVDMASAACPSCKILVVQGDDDIGDGLLLANNIAATKGATVISNSWGAPEDSQLATEEPYFNHPGIAVFVADGDDGYDDGGKGPDYPGTSAYTFGVGGTTLTPSGTARGWSETAWKDGGSSCSGSVVKPSYQTSTACGFRAASDLAAVGDPNTGVAVYNSDSGGWTEVGGTSAASPLVAGIFAATGHGVEVASFVYKNTAAFNDVTTGTNGKCGTAMCQAAAGWDGPTGLGTPNATAIKAIAPTDLAPTVTITSPVGGATIDAGFTVTATATDDHGVAKVELRIDGTLSGTSTTSPYTFTTAAGVAAGIHTIAVRAYDSAGQTTDADLSVTVIAAPATGGTGGGSAGDVASGGSTGGCDVTSGGSSQPVLLAMFVVVALTVRRRRW